MSRLKGELKKKREIKVLKPSWRNFYILRYDNNSDLYNSLRNGFNVLWRKTETNIWKKYTMQNIIMLNIAEFWKSDLLSLGL